MSSVSTGQEVSKCRLAGDERPISTRSPAKIPDGRNYYFTWNGAATRAQTNGDFDNCAKEENSDLRVNYCTRSIQSGQLSTSKLAFNNRAKAYRDKEEYDRAIQDYDQTIWLEPKNAVSLRTRGIIHFYLSQFQSAWQDEALAVQSDPTDAYSVIWLYLAQARTSVNAQTQLTNNASSLKLPQWPGHVIQLYLGRATPDEVLSIAEGSSPGSSKASNSIFGRAERRKNRRHA